MDFFCWCDLFALFHAFAGVTPKVRTLFQRFGASRTSFLGQGSVCYAYYDFKLWFLLNKIVQNISTCKMEIENVFAYIAFYLHRCPETYRAGCDVEIEKKKGKKKEKSFDAADLQ